MKTRNMLLVDIEELSKFYDITEDGMVYSKLKGRWLKPQINIYGYVTYCLSYSFSKPTCLLAHSLVALRYIGPPPTPRHEIDHLDDNKQNNHYTNLDWKTHSANILASYARGRRGYWWGKSRPSPELVTRQKMSDAKKKRVLFLVGKKKIIFESIEEASTGLGTYRKMIYNRVKDGKPFMDGYLSFIEDKFTP